MAHIFGLGYILKVFKAVVGFVAIFMIGDVFFRPRSDPGF